MKRKNIQKLGLCLIGAFGVLVLISVSDTEAVTYVIRKKFYKEHGVSWRKASKEDREAFLEGFLEEKEMQESIEEKQKQRNRDIAERKKDIKEAQKRRIKQMKKRQKELKKRKEEMRRRQREMEQEKVKRMQEQMKRLREQQKR